MTKNRSNAGFSLVEVSFAVAFTGALSAMTFLVMTTAIKGDEALRVRMDMQSESVRAMREITELLKKCGPIDANADGIVDNAPGEFPHIYAETAAQAGYYGFLNAGNPAIVQPAGLTVLQGAGASNEIAFRLPRDVDGAANQGPTNVATGNIEWGTDYYALVIVPGVFANTHELQFRRYNTAFQLTEQRTLGNNVVRIVIYTAATEPQPVVAPQKPLGANQLRVTVWFYALDSKQKPVYLQQTSTVNMRSIED